jgi:hypothetical protein
MRRRYDLVVRGRAYQVGAVVSSVATLVCVGGAILSPIDLLPSFVMVGCAVAYCARGCWREGLRVRGNSIVVRDGTGTSIVNFDDVSGVSTAARGPHLPPEVMLTLRSGRRVFIGGKWWWWRDRAKRYAKGPLEMREADLKALAWRPGLWSHSRFARPRLVAVSLVLLACATCLVPFTIAAATATDVADVLLRTVLFLPVGGLLGFLTFVLLSVCRPYVPPDTNQVPARLAKSGSHRTVAMGAFIPPWASEPPHCH